MFLKCLMFIITTCYKAEIALCEQDQMEDHITERYASEDFYDYCLRNNGYDLKFRIYEDANIVITLSDGIYEDVLFRITDRDLETHFDDAMTTLEVLIVHYFWGLWSEVVAEIRATSVPTFVEKYRTKNIASLGFDIYTNEASNC